MAEMNARDSFLTTVGSSLECLCASLEYAIDLRTLELLQGSEVVGDKEAVAAAKEVLWLRIQQRAATKLSESRGVSR